MSPVRYCKRLLERATDLNVACMGERKGVCRVLVGKPEGKKPLGRPRCRWVDNISMDLWDVGIWTGLGWPKIETVGVRL